MTTFYFTRAEVPETPEGLALYRIDFVAVDRGAPFSCWYHAVDRPSALAAAKENAAALDTHKLDLIEKEPLV